jgi:hypothetical protein
LNKKTAREKLAAKVNARIANVAYGPPRTRKEKQFGVLSCPCENCVDACTDWRSRISPQTFREVVDRLRTPREIRLLNNAIYRSLMREYGQTVVFAPTGGGIP